MNLIMWLVTAYGLSQILVYGTIFDKPRDWLSRNSRFIGDLLGCMMCTSTWVGFLFSFIFYSPTATHTTLPYINVLLDGMLASGGVWAINAIVEWFEENKPPKND